MIKFHPQNIVSVEDEAYLVNPTTYLLLKQFISAPRMLLSKEDIRQDVLFDEDARNGTIRQAIFNARQDILRCYLPIDIYTIIGKGYQLQFLTDDEIPPADY